MTNNSGKTLELIYALRQSGITDSRILNVIEATDRSKFLSNNFRHRAADDIALPISSGQTISQPTVVAKMMQLLNLGSKDTVLEIGTGSGYQAVLLSKLVRRVYSVERQTILAKQASKIIAEQHIGNITVILGDGALGLPIQAPFDKILITAAAEEIPKLLLEQLKIGGLMVLPLGPTEDYQILTKITKNRRNFKYEESDRVKFVPLLPDVD